MTQTDPFSLFDHWFAQAQDSEAKDPNAMTLATVDESGMPDARTVLLKDVSAGGFAFYTNKQSKKGSDLASCPQACLLFYWKSFGRQIRIQGAINAVSPTESDAYFATRPRGSQVGAWASQQSRTIVGREELEQAVAGCQALT